MPGLNLGVMGGVKATGSGTTGAPASSATEAAFGQGMTQPGSPSTAAALAPNDPFGIAFWTGCACLALLLAIRYSLPS